AVGRLPTALTRVLPSASVRAHRRRLRGGVTRTAAGAVASCRCHVPRQYRLDHRPGGHTASQTSPRATGARGSPHDRGLAQRTDARAPPPRYPQECAPLGGIYAAFWSTLWRG